jgi:hypothetical protein
MIPLGSYDLSDPKNPLIADRKRSTKLAHCYTTFTDKHYYMMVNIIIV